MKTTAPHIYINTLKYYLFGLVSLSKNINPSLVLVQPMKTRPFITERLLMGRKKSNQTIKLLHVSARSEEVEIYNCDNKFSILGASFTGIVKNVRVLSHRYAITYAWTASNLTPEICVDHVHVHMLTFMCCATAITSPTPTLLTRE